MRASWTRSKPPPDRRHRLEHYFVWARFRAMARSCARRLSGPPLTDLVFTQSRTENRYALFVELLSLSVAIPDGNPPRTFPGIAEGEPSWTSAPTPPPAFYAIPTK